MFRENESDHNRKSQASFTKIKNDKVLQITDDIFNHITKISYGGKRKNMKNRISALLALLLAVSPLTGCQGGASEPQDAEGYEGTGEVTEETVTIQVNVDGMGVIAVTDDGSDPVIDPDIPFTSSYNNVAPGTEVKMTCEPDEEYMFVRWTRNGEIFSKEQTISVTADENAEYRAVCMMSSGYTGTPVTDIHDAKTLGDVLGLPTYGGGYGETRYAYTFDLDGVIYQAVAELDQETSKALFDLDFDDPEYDAKENDLVAPLAIAKLINITDGVPAQSELDAYVGKTFGELFEEGWYCTGWNFEENAADMNNRYYTFKAGFDASDVDPAAFEEEDLAELTVKSMTYSGLGDAGFFEE